jgi:hypothetical protein
MHAHVTSIKGTEHADSGASPGFWRGGRFLKNAGFSRPISKIFPRRANGKYSRSRSPTPDPEPPEGVHVISREHAAVLALHFLLTKDSIKLSLDSLANYEKLSLQVCSQFFVCNLYTAINTCKWCAWVRERETEDTWTPNTAPPGAPTSWIIA